MGKSKTPELRLRIRVVRGAEILLGPGKADLLDAIRRKGNLRSAAKSLGMSYMRAWTLLQTMNRAFRPPLVETGRGGMEHGRAVLTEAGIAVIGLYREMERAGRSAAGAHWRRLRRRLRT